MRIAFLVKVFPPRHETFILNQLQGLCERGVEVDVIAQRRGEAQSSDFGDSAPQYRVLYREQEAAQRSSRIGKVLSRAGRLLGRSSANGRDGQQNSDAKLFQTGGPYDIVHCQYMTLGAAAVALRDAGVFNAPIVTSVRGFDITRRSARDVAGFDALLERGDLFLPVCDSFRERLIELGVSPDRIVVHRSGIDLSKFGLRKGTRPRLCEAPGEPFRETGSDPFPESIRILSVARLVEKKGIEFAIRAIATLVKGDRHLLPERLSECFAQKVPVTFNKSPVPQIEYTIIGDGPLRGELETLARELGLQPKKGAGPVCRNGPEGTVYKRGLTPFSAHVRFLGWLPHEEVIEHIYHADMVVNPSITADDGCQEGIPNTLKEAMACEVPVVATRHSGIPELVEDGVSGRLVPEREPDSLAVAILQLASPNCRRRMGAAGRRRVERDYDLTLLNNQLLEIYTHVSSSFRKAAVVS